MKASIHKTTALEGVITIPGSKSHAIRALILATLSEGTSLLNNMPEGSDINDAILACQSLGAHITQDGSQVIVISKGTPFTPIQSTLYTGNSGISTRFILPMLGLRTASAEPITLNCGEQMQARPMGALIKALSDLGLTIHSHSFPIQVSGELIGGKTELTHTSSQFLSSLLLALPLAPKDSVITLNHLSSRPYIDITKSYLTAHGIAFTHEQCGTVDVFSMHGNQSYSARNRSIPGDFSSASYFIAAGLLFNGTLTLKGLDMSDPQGDKGMVDLAIEMGGDVTVHEKELLIRGGRPLKGLHIDANAFPDLLPTLAVLGTLASGETALYNVPEARHKETDRIHSMTEGLRLMGADIEEKADGMIIKPSRLEGRKVNGYGDHRTVMALTLAGMLAEGTTEVSQAESVNKTFPSFFDEMKRLGAAIEVNHD